MKKEKTFAFRLDLHTLALLYFLGQKSGNAKSVVIRNLIWQAARDIDLSTGLDFPVQEQEIAD